MRENSVEAVKLYRLQVDKEREKSAKLSNAFVFFGKIYFQSHENHKLRNELIKIDLSIRPKERMKLEFLRKISYAYKKNVK